MMDYLPFIIAGLVLLGATFSKRGYRQWKLREEAGPNPSPTFGDFFAPLKEVMQLADENSVRKALPVLGAAFGTLIALLFAFWFIDTKWPEWAANYRLHDGPVWSLLGGVLAIGLIYVMTKGKLRTGLVLLLTALIVWAVVSHAVITFAHGSDLSRGQVAAAAEKERRAAAAQEERNALAGVFEHISGCKFKKEPFEFTSSWKNFPGQCKTDYWLEADECVEYKETASGPTLGPYGYCGEANGATAPPKPIKALYARAYGGKTFTHDVTVSQPPSKR